MFAGPNGSGKSTIKEVIPAQLLGVYINPDEIEKELARTQQLDLTRYAVTGADQELIAYLHSSSLLKKQGLLHDLQGISSTNNVIQFHNVRVNSYFASVIASFIREKLLHNQTSFTFETVMSSADKVDFLHRARQRGFRTYLYFVATEDPQINIARVAHRVRTGGHPVPEEKIVSRYHRSMNLLASAVRNASRAYVFDNSGSGHIWLAEITNGTEMEFKAEWMPNWFKTALLDPILSSDPESAN